MSFLFRNAHFFQYVQNGFTLYFKLSGQIIDSNFHPFSNFLRELSRYAIISTSRHCCLCDICT